jgi:hypothetical protein
MPKTDLHRVQKRKNIVLFIILLGLMALIYVITLVRMAPPQA